MRKTNSIFLIILFFGTNSFSQTVVGYIYRVKGTGFLKQPSGKIMKLTERDYANVLRVGQQLKAEKNGEIFIYLCGKMDRVFSEELLVLEKCRTGRIPNWLEKFPSAGESNRKTRGPDDFILFPNESEKIKNVIRPETAIFRWVSTNAKINLSLSIEENKTLRFDEKDINGEDGFYSSRKLKDFLKEVRKKYPNAKVQLKVETLGDKNSVAFRIFSKAQEKSLRRGLNDLKTEKGILLHLARAVVFTNYRLYIEAAKEYEEALKFSPESIDLLVITAHFQDLAGNLSRKDELDAQIKEFELENEMIK